MVVATNSITRTLITTMCLTLLFALSTASRGFSAGPLPDYVIEEFGEPPAVPDAPMSPAMQFALRVAFVDSVSLGTWAENQDLALAEIPKSKDPRFAWIISDMMRFVSS